MAIARFSLTNIAKEFGLTKAQAHSEYNVFQRKVQNFNKANLTNYSPINEYRYSKIAPNNSTIRAIQATTSTPLSKLGARSFKNIQNISMQYNMGKFNGLINNSTYLQNELKKVGTKYHTMKGFIRKCKTYAKKLHSKEKRDPLISSDSADWNVPEQETDSSMNLLEEINANDVDLPF